MLTSWISTSFQQIHPNIWRLLSMFFAKTVLFQFNLIHVSVSCCKWIVLVQDRSDDSKHWWIDVSIEIFIISNALLDSHVSVLSLKLLIMLVFLWPCIKRANVIAYLSADAENKFCTSSRWLHFGIGWMQRHSGCHPWCHLGWFNDGSIGTNGVKIRSGVSQVLQKCIT